MLKKRFAEKVPGPETQLPTGQGWYLTHHGVYHKQKGKLRVVFDASLKYQGVSLNDCLHQGPDLTNELLGVLTRFRQYQIGFTADIEKMFYQVRVPSEHKDFLRFLWFENVLDDQPPAHYRITVHVFGAKSSPSCANLALDLPLIIHIRA